jgi:UDP-GlcNAc:undecaprenyl-phosphate GlcNAc-1-phosphate transferase
LADWRMTFPFNFFAAAFAGAFLTTLLTLPLWRKWCLRTGLVDDPQDRKNYDAPKIHTQVTPLAGGFAVLTGILLPLLGGALLLKGGLLHIASANAILHGVDRRAVELGALALGAVLITFLGWWDDRHELKPIPKLAGQFLVALLVAAACKRITLFVPSELFSYAVTVLWVLTVINAFNFMDNMNGLCAGLGALGAFFFALIAAAAGQYLVAVTGFLMFGALLGFLPWNFPRAKSFLGDAGSHLVGYLLAVMAILPHFYTKQNPKPLAVLAPLFVLAIPLLDILQVSLLRTLNKKPFWIGDTNHLSHRLTRVGWSKTGAVLLLWLAAAVLGALGSLLR